MLITDSHSKIFICFALILTLFNSRNVAASTVNHVLIKWPLNDHLGQKTIISSLAERDGALWISTLDGLTRYDGSEFHRYNPYRSSEGYIQSTQIISILQKKDGNIAVVTRDNGILIYEYETDRFLRSHWTGKNGETSFLNITEVYLDRSGNTWISHDRKYVSKIPQNLTNIKSYEISGGIPIIQFTETPDGKIYGVNESGFIVVFTDNLNAIKLLDIGQACPHSRLKVSSIASTIDNNLVVGTKGNGLFVLNTASGDCHSINSNSNRDFSNSYVHQVFYDKDSNFIWIATDQGLFKANHHKVLQSFDSSNSELFDNEIFFVAPYRNGILLVGTYNGLFFLIPTGFKVYDRFSNSMLHSIVGISGKNEEDIWIATYDGVLFYEKASGQIKNIQELLPQSGLINGQVVSIGKSETGLWLGYRSAGFEYFDSDSEYHLHNKSFAYQMPTHPVTSFLEVNKDLVFIGTFGSGLFKLSRESNSINKIHIGNDHIVLLFQSSKDDIWVGTETGLFKFNFQSGGVTPVNPVAGSVYQEAHPVIWNMTKTSDGSLYMGSMHCGLFKLSNDGASYESVEFDLSQSVSSSIGTIYSLESDLFGNIWFSTNNGLFRLETDNGKIQKFSRHNGLVLNEFEFAASYSSSNGYLYFGGDMGFVQFDPATVQTIHFIPKVVLNSLELSSGLILARQLGGQNTELELSHNDQYIKFNFSVLDYLDPEKNRYRYMLEGFDSDWIDNATQGSAVYTNLPSGNYVFRVQGANSSGVWNLDGISLPVHVSPPPWKSWWAITCYIILTCFGLWIIKRAYDSIIIKRRAAEQNAVMQNSLERADDEIQEQIELREELVRSVHRHNLSTLNLVRDFMSHSSEHIRGQHEADATGANSRRIRALELLESCLFYQDEALMADLHRFTDMAIADFLRDCPFDTATLSTINDVDEQLVPAAVASPLAIIVFELLDNCFRHAFEDHIPAKYVEVNFKVSADHMNDRAGFRLVVRDNGVGIPRNINPEVPETAGLSVVRIMARKLSASVVVDRDRGTSVSLEFATSGAPF